MARPRTKNAEEEAPTLVQAPKRREIWSFDELEILQLSVQVVVIAKDSNGKKLGTLPLETKTFYEPEDLADWAENIAEDLGKEDVMENMRKSMLDSMNGTPGGA